MRIKSVITNKIEIVFEYVVSKIYPRRQRILEISYISWIIILCSGFFSVFTTDNPFRFSIFGVSLYVISMGMVFVLVIMPYVFKRRWGIDLYGASKE